MIETLKNFWAERTGREKVILGTGGVLAIILIVYNFIISPINDNEGKFKQQYISQKTLLNWMQQADQHIQAMQGRGSLSQTQSTQSLLSQSEASLSSLQLSSFLTNIQQNKTKQVTLTFNQVPFDKLMQWTQSLWQQSQIDVASLDVSPAGKSGLVKATIVLDH